ncbi:hypothetical protein HMPREF1979_02036 [Actinomyces johnsonii F0542]|uniref:Uncharacterized protein n=1 Tax=Actinomyces johnsonii F0542 TaxID=1321818 RepID=U1RX20_9ACTO|nr:hypothetical protein HMPREF1979_02036 [Actinomyces johnsonii F0542]
MGTGFLFPTASAVSGRCAARHRLAAAGRIELVPCRRGMAPGTVTS